MTADVDAVRGESREPVGELTRVLLSFALGGHGRLPECDRRGAPSISAAMARGFEKYIERFLGY